MKFKTTLFIFLAILKMVAAQDRPPNAQPGKCYAKCLISDQYEMVGEKYAVYTGEEFDNPLLEKRNILLRPSSTKWGKNSKGEMYLQTIPDSTVAIWVVKDTSVLKNFELRTFEKRHLVRPEGFTEWREVLCGEKVTGYTVRQIQEALNKAGYYYEAIDGKMSPRTKAALTKFQKDKGLPVGNLDFETLDALGIQY